ncbi:MAG: hypothetical protein ACI9PP_001049 [Halobacteriales archaeon]|jgi:hypothetical protein
MDRDALRTVAIALLVIVVLSIAAATVEVTNQESTSGGGATGAGGPVVGSTDGNRSEGSMGDGVGGGGMPMNESASEGENQVAGICIPFFLRLEGILTLLLVVAGFWYVLKKIMERFFADIITFVTAFLGLNVLVFFIDCGGQRNFNMRVDTAAAIEAGGGAAQKVATEINAVTDPSIHPIVLILVGLLVVGPVAALLMRRDNADAEIVNEAVENDDVTEEAEQGTSLSSIGRVAGEAADRMDQAEAFENEVYRAWVEMTTELDVDHPESSTPGEFAREAVDAGMGPDDVDRLTELFEEVRYGGRMATEDREAAAIDTLRRIEDQYADE